MIAGSSPAEGYFFLLRETRREKKEKRQILNYTHIGDEEDALRLLIALVSTFFITVLPRPFQQSSQSRAHT